MSRILRKEKPQKPRLLWHPVKLALENIKQVNVLFIMKKLSVYNMYDVKLIMIKRTFMYRLTLCLCYFFIAYHSSYVHAEISEEEREALIATYTLTNGSNWTSNEGWLGEAGTECSWSGVSCVDNHVIGLNLENKGLTGKIPKALGFLSHLKELNLSSNMLKGTIPSMFERNSGLDSLLGGSALEEGSDLSKLEVLHLHNNQLHDNIGYLGLKGYRILTLHGNKLKGEIDNCPTDNVLTAIGGSAVAVVNEDPICSSSIFGGTSNVGVGSDLLSNWPPLHTLTLFDNCFTVDYSKIPLDLLNLQVFDLGNQNACSENSNNNIPLVKVFYDFEIHIPLVQVNGQGYEVDLVRHYPSGLNGMYWRVSNISQINSSIEIPEQPLVSYDIKTSKLTFNKLYLGAETVEATLYPYIHPIDSQGIYFQYIP